MVYERIYFMKISQDQAKKLKTRLNQKVVDVKDSDLDIHGQICCPPKSGELWDMHPRVYMPIKEDGVSMCPYCGAVYKYMAK